MNLEFSAGGIVIAWYLIKKAMDDISKIAEPICVEIEKMALDGVIDKAERKALAMKAIVLAEQQGKIKFNFLSRRIVSFVIDRVAAKLPDFKVSQVSKDLITEAKKQ